MGCAGATLDIVIYLMLKLFMLDMKQVIRVHI